MSRRIISEVTALFFILLYLYTGISKLMDYAVFKEQLAIVPIFKSIYPLVAVSVPACEIAIAVLLFWPTWRLKGFYASFILMSLFTVYVVYLLTLKTELPCSCGGIIEFLSWKQHLVFNIATLILLGISIYQQKRTLSDHQSVSVA